jgi:hypothetical protein
MHQQIVSQVRNLLFITYSMFLHWKLGKTRCLCVHSLRRSATSWRDSMGIFESFENCSIHKLRSKAQVPVVTVSSCIHLLLSILLPTLDADFPQDIYYAAGATQTPVQSAAIKQFGVAGLSTHAVPAGHTMLLARPPAHVGAHTPGHSAPTMAMHAVVGSYVQEYPSPHPSPDDTLHLGGGKQTPVQSAAIRQSGVAGLSLHVVPLGQAGCGPGVKPAQVGAQTPGQSERFSRIQATLGSMVHENPSQHPFPDVTLHLGGGKQTPVQSAAIKQPGVAGLSTQKVPEGHGACGYAVKPAQLGTHFPGQSVVPLQSVFGSNVHE